MDPKFGGLKPEWLHRTLRLEVKENVTYEFRTLSIYDVWSLWPHISPLLDAVVRERPIAMTGHLREVIAVLNPILAQSDEHLGIVGNNRAFVATLWEFYSQQDWSRIRALGEDVQGRREASGGDPEEADRIFMGVCAAAAKMLNMSMLEFMQQRFEYCADAFLMLRDAHARAQEEAEGGGPIRNGLSGGQLLTVMSAAMPMDKPETKPEWMEYVEQYARDHPPSSN